MMKIRFSRKGLSEFAFLILLSGLWFAIGWVGRGWSLGSEIRLVEQARRLLLDHYPFGTFTSRDLSHAAIRGMLERTQDPHVSLMEPEVSARFLDDFRGESGVIGVVAEARQGEIVVTVVFPGEPADQAGLKTGDVILAVDGVEFDEFTTEVEASTLIRGKIGEPARLVVRRGDETLELAPIRKPRPIAEGKMLENDIAYLAQYQFTANAPELVKGYLQEFLAQNPKGLVWDLRSNSGGSMDAAQQILSYFIQEGLLFSAEVKDGEKRQYLAGGDGLAVDIPIIVLVSENTHSSAETAAIAMQERGRARLFGATTHGKGTIQTTERLPEGCLLHFTVAKWLSPSGRWVQDSGVTTDREFSDNPATSEDEVLQAAILALLGQ